MASFKHILPLLLSLLLLGAHSIASPAEESAEASTSVQTDPAGSPATMLSPLKRFFGNLGGQPDLLPPDQAFTAAVQVRDATTLVVKFKPEDGYYLYRDRISFTIKEPAELGVANVTMPEGTMKADPTFGTVAVFHSPFEAVIDLKRSQFAASSGRLHVSYQGCSELGVCYPPIEKTFDFALPALSVTSANGATTASADRQTAAASPVPARTSGDPRVATSPASWLDLNQSARLFEAQSVGWVVGGFFGFGLLLSLTPCVWPMFPILSGIIAGQGTSISRMRAFWLSASYVLGMAITYAVVGIVAGLSGSLLSTALQTPWALAAMAALFVVLALSMFGFYELQLPAFLHSRIASANNRVSKRTAASVFAMGAASAVVVGPCIAAPLAGALLYIGRTQDIVLGGAALFAMALGKGIPLIAIGTSLGSLLPRSGAWMASIKTFLGVLLLGAAVWTISPFIPLSVSMVLAGTMLIVYGVHLHALDTLPANAGGFARMGKGFGVIGLLVGAIYVVGAFNGSRNFLMPLAGLTGSDKPAAQAPLSFETIRSVGELEQKLHQASGRFVMLDFYADWCVSCKEMEHLTFSNPNVRDKLQNVVLLQADVTKNLADDKALLARFGLFGPPGILLFDQAGQEITPHRVIGFMNADRFSRVLDDAFR